MTVSMARAVTTSSSVKPECVRRPRVDRFTGCKLGFPDFAVAGSTTEKPDEGQMKRSILLTAVAAAVACTESAPTQPGLTRAGGSALVTENDRQSASLPPQTACRSEERRVGKECRSRGSP